MSFAGNPTFFIHDENTHLPLPAPAAPPTRLHLPHPALHLPSHISILISLTPQRAKLTPHHRFPLPLITSISRPPGAAPPSSSSARATLPLRSSSPSRSRHHLPHLRPPLSFISPPLSSPSFVSICPYFTISLLPSPFSPPLQLSLPSLDCSLLQRCTKYWIRAHREVHGQKTPCIFHLYGFTVFSKCAQSFQAMHIERCMARKRRAFINCMVYHCRLFALVHHDLHAPLEGGERDERYPPCLLLLTLLFFFLLSFLFSLFFPSLLCFSPSSSLLPVTAAPLHHPLDHHSHLLLSFPCSSSLPGAAGGERER